jgi:hypothetical protein
LVNFVDTGYGEIGVAVKGAACKVGDFAE